MVGSDSIYRKVGQLARENFRLGDRGIGRAWVEFQPTIGVNGL